MDETTKTALANEARRQELGKKVHQLRGEASATASMASAASSANNDALRRLQAAQAELAAMESGAGPGLTEDFGERSAVDLVERTERFAGKGGAYDYVQEHPECTEAEAAEAWKVAALAATGRVKLVQDPLELGAIYRERLLNSCMVLDNTWEAQRAWMLATPKETAMGL